MHSGCKGGQFQRIDVGKLEVSLKQCFEIAGTKVDARSRVQAQVESPSHCVEGQPAVLQEVIGQQRLVEEPVAGSLQLPAAGSERRGRPRGRVLLPRRRHCAMASAFSAAIRTRSTASFAARQARNTHSCAVRSDPAAASCSAVTVTRPGCLQLLLRVDNVSLGRG